MSQRRWSCERELSSYLRARRQPIHHPGPWLDDALACWARESPQMLRCLDGRWEDFQSWRQAARAFVTERLAFPCDPIESEFRVLDRCEHASYVEEQGELTTAPPLRAPMTVLSPKGWPGKRPAIVALHDMGGMRVFGREKLLPPVAGEPAFFAQCRQSNYEGVSIAAELARRGYVVAVIDAINFGLRTLEAAKDPGAFKARRLAMDEQTARAVTLRVSYEEEPVLVRNVMATGRTWPGLIVCEDRRTVDYLCSRADVDPQRLGCIGLSFGAYRSNYLAALDERIKAAVSVCWLSTMDALLGYNIQGAMGWFSLIPGIFAQMDLPDLLALAAPRALMVLSGWQDNLMQPFGVAKAHRYLRECFERMGCPEQLASMVYDCRHTFNRTMQADAFAWLDEKLRPDASGELAGRTPMATAIGDR